VLGIATFREKIGGLLEFDTLPVQAIGQAVMPMEVHTLE
jgi:hypothetical protein